MNPPAKKERSPAQIASLEKARIRAAEIRAQNSKTLEMDVVDEVLETKKPAKKAPPAPPVADSSSSDEEEIVVKKAPKAKKKKKRIIVVQNESDDSDSDDDVQIIRLPRRAAKSSNKSTTSQLAPTPPIDQHERARLQRMEALRKAYQPPPNW